MDDQRKIDLAPMVGALRKTGPDQSCRDFDEAFALAFPSDFLRMDLFRGPRLVGHAQSIAPPAVNPQDLENLRHMLGADAHRRKGVWGFRNHFAPSQSDMPSMLRLQEAGLVRPGGPYADRAVKALTFFHATEAGCKAAGLSVARTKAALES